MTASFDLPPETAAFLEAQHQLEYDASKAEPGRVTLHPLKQLSLGEVWIAPEQSDDPHHGEDGYYSVPAVSLSAACEGYSPEFILLWLPEEKKFGTWDSDHWTLTIFDRAGWSDIERDPLTYIDAQWRASNPVGVPAKPWGRHPFKVGRPF